MKLNAWLAQFGMTNLRIKTHYLEMEWAPKDADRAAAWELYIELLTRVATQPLPVQDGDEQTALDSVYLLFGLTREIIKRNGPDCIEFTKIAVVVLNQIIRPFTAQWHSLSLVGAFKETDQCVRFRQNLEELQSQLRIYCRMLADMAGVEDLTSLEPTE